MLRTEWIVTVVAVPETSYRNVGRRYPRRSAHNSLSARVTTSEYKRQACSCEITPRCLRPRRAGTYRQ